MAVVVKEDASVIKKAKVMGGAAAVCLLGAYATWNMDVNMWVPAVLIMAGVVLLKQAFPWISGAVGERRVAKELAKLPEGYYIYHDLDVPFDSGKTTQLDHVVVGPTGLFVIETKNHTGTIYGGYKQQWSQVTTNDRGYKRSYKFYNPVKQNDGHVRAVREYLDGFSSAPEWIQSIICFTDRRVELKVANFKHAEVIRLHDLADVLQGPGQRLDPVTVERINGHLHALVRSKAVAG